MAVSPNNRGVPNRKPMNRGGQRGDPASSSGLPNPNQTVGDSHPPRRGQGQPRVPKTQVRRHPDDHPQRQSQMGMQNSRANSSLPAQRQQGQMTQRKRRPMPVEDDYDIQGEVLDSEFSETQPKKKKKHLGLKIALGVLVLSVAGGFGYIKYKQATYKPDPHPVLPVYELTGRYGLDMYKDALIGYNREELSALLPESWVVKEWEYANGNEVRQNFINSVCAYVDFTYPEVQAMNDLGGLAVDSAGEKVMVEADMLEGEPFTVTVVDYDSLSATMREDVVLIADLYKDSGYRPEDYTYRSDMVDLMLNYLLEKPNLPTKTVELSVPVEQVEIEVTNNDGSVSTKKQYMVVDDSMIDNLLFGSEEFHNMCDTFGTIIYQYDNEALVGVNAPEEIEDEPIESEDVLDSSLDSATEDTGSAVEGESASAKDAESKADKDSKSDKKGDSKDSKSDKKDDSKDNKDAVVEDSLPADLDGIEVADSEAELVEETQEPEEPHNEFGYVYESVIPYTWIGAYFCQNEYTGDLNPEPQEGDGSFELPASIGTSIITKCLCADGEYHDVEVTMRGYWVGEDAIDYAISFSEKNRGFDKNSAIKLICFEIEVKNLESEPIVVNSELFLSDSQANPSVRTGTVYGFYDSMEIPAGKKMVINDWATSTELPQKYVCWGKSFSRKYPVVCFKLLAGSGEEVPSYDANDTYINRDGKKTDASEANSTLEANEGNETPVTEGTTVEPAVGQEVG